MSTELQAEIETTIHELRRQKANAEAWKAHIEAVYPWRQHDARIYQERADEAELALLVVEQMVAAL